MLLHGVTDRHAVGVYATYLETKLLKRAKVLYKLVHKLQTMAK